jgi:hypothetical protein
MATVIRDFQVWQRRNKFKHELIHLARKSDPRNATSSRARKQGENACYTKHIPVHTIAHMLGVPEKDSDSFAAR